MRFVRISASLHSEGDYALLINKKLRFDGNSCGYFLVKKIESLKPHHAENYLLVGDAFNGHPANNSGNYTTKDGRTVVGWYASGFAVGIEDESEPEKEQAALVSKSDLSYLYGSGE